MIGSNIEIILLVTGVITAGVVVQFFAPRGMVRNTFREELSGEAAILLARHWGLVVFCVGALMIWAAKHPEGRNPIIIAAAFEKVVLVGCILASPLRRLPMPKVIAAGDATMVLLFAGYLLGY